MQPDAASWGNKKGKCYVELMWRSISAMFSANIQIKDFLFPQEKALFFIDFNDSLKYKWRIFFFFYFSVRVRNTSSMTLPDCDSVSLLGRWPLNRPSRCVCVDGLYWEKPVQKLLWSGWLRGWKTGQMLYEKSPRESVPPGREEVRAKGRVSDTSNTTGNSGFHGSLLHH